MTVKYICHVKFPADVAILWEGWVNFHKAGAPLAAGVIRHEIFHGLMDRQGFVFIEAESYAAVTQDLVTSFPSGLFIKSRKRVDLPFASLIKAN